MGAVGRCVCKPPEGGDRWTFEFLCTVMLFLGGVLSAFTTSPCQWGWLSGIIENLESPTGIVVQLAECLPSMHEALGSDPSPTLCKAGVWCQPVTHTWETRAGGIRSSRSTSTAQQVHRSGWVMRDPDLKTIS